MTGGKPDTRMAGENSFSAPSQDIETTIEQLAREEAEVQLSQQRQEHEQAALLKGAPVLGLPDDMEADVDQIVEEVRREIAERKRRGSLKSGVRPVDVKRAVDEKLRALRRR